MNEAAGMSMGGGGFRRWSFYQKSTLLDSPICSSTTHFVSHIKTIKVLHMKLPYTELRYFSIKVSIVFQDLRWRTKFTTAPTAWPFELEMPSIIEPGAFFMQSRSSSTKLYPLPMNTLVDKRETFFVLCLEIKGDKFRTGSRGLDEAVVLHIRLSEEKKGENQTEWNSPLPHSPCICNY